MRNMKTIKQDVTVSYYNYDKHENYQARCNLFRLWQIVKEEGPQGKLSNFCQILLSLGNNKKYKNNENNKNNPHQYLAEGVVVGL